MMAKLAYVAFDLLAYIHNVCKVIVEHTVDFEL